MRSENGEIREGDQNSELKDVARTEHEYLHERLRQELGREPTEDELDEWLRQHTEGY
jgi:DNA-directed RNA polymerase specialized sigma subunit